MLACYISKQNIVLLQNYIIKNSSELKLICLYASINNYITTCYSIVSTRGHTPTEPQYILMADIGLSQKPKRYPTNVFAKSSTERVKRLPWGLAESIPKFSSFLPPQFPKPLFPKPHIFCPIPILILQLI